MRSNKHIELQDETTDGEISERSIGSRGGVSGKRLWIFLTLLPVYLYLFVTLFYYDSPNQQKLMAVYNEFPFAEKLEPTPSDPAPSPGEDTPVKPEEPVTETPKSDDDNPQNPPSQPEPEPEKEPEPSVPTEPETPVVPKKPYQNLKWSIDGYTQVSGADYKETMPTVFHLRNPAPMRINPKTYLDKLEVLIVVYDPDHLNLVIRDADRPRYEIPFEEPYPHVRNPKKITLEESNFDIFVRYDPFDVILIRKKTEEVIFKLTDRLIYTDLYIEFSFFTPTNQIYGLGERLRNLQFTPGTYTLFMLDQSGEIDPGKTGFNQQGHHSMYMMRENSGKYHVNLLRNINAQEVILGRDGNGNNKVTWKLIGGVIDLNFFLGDSPEEASRKYHAYLGGWTLPALWHLGHHQSKFSGYFNGSHLEQIILGFENASLPLESLWSDLDYTVKGKSFVLDETKFPPEKMNELYKKHKKRWVPIVDPWIPYDRNEPIYEYERMMKLSMKDSRGSICTGNCLSGKTVFIDFLHPDTESYWQMLLGKLNDKWTFDGVWLDANEVTNYLDKPLYVFREHKYYDLPFYPGNKNLFSQRIVAVDCVHYGNLDEYNVRSIPSLLQSKYTYNFLKKRFPFPFILSRGSMMGGGQFAYTWIPDVRSKWNSIIPSLGSTLTFSLFGIPMVGVDICGFIGDNKTPPELCARWYQLAVFYPFARNAHTPLIKEDNFQEPYRFSKDGDFYVAIVDAIRLRYSMLKHILTLFYSKKNLSKPSGTGTIMRPLFFGFYDDPTLPPYGDKVHDEQFMLGDSIMAAPVLYENAKNIEAYFPNCRWYDLRTFGEVAARGRRQRISADFDESVPHFLRGGHMVFRQDPTNVSHAEELSQIFTMVVGLGDFAEVDGGMHEMARAEGEILGVSNYSEHYIDEKCSNTDCILSIKAEYKTRASTLVLKANNRHQDSNVEPVFVNELYLLGVFREFEPAFTKAQIKSVDTEVEIEVSLEGNWVKLTFSELKFENNKEYTFTFSP